MSKLETGLHYSLKLDALPPNWKVGYVGDFADAIQPGFASGKHNKEGAGIPHIRPFNIDRQGKLDLSEIKSVAPDSDAKRLHTGDVLFNNTNSPELIGKTAVIASAGDWGFSNHMTRIRFKDDVAAKFAAYQLHFLWMTGYYLHNCVKHVNQASISSKTLANAVPFIAPPLDQQKRIVAEIDKQFSRLDEAVANLKRVKANLKRYKAAVLKAAVEGRLVETEAERARREGRSYESGAQLLQRILETRRSHLQGKGKYKEPAAPDTTVLPELAEGWVWAQLENAVSGIVVGYVGPVKEHIVDRSNTRFLSTTHVGENVFIDDEFRYVSDEFDRKNGKSSVVPGDILIARHGDSGKACLVPEQIPRAQVSNAVIVHPNSEITNPVYLMYAINATRRELQKRKVGGVQQVVNTKSMGAFPIPIPPRLEQDEIVKQIESRLSVLSETEVQVVCNLQRAERLRKSILSKAFSGRLEQTKDVAQPSNASHGIGVRQPINNQGGLL